MGHFVICSNLYEDSPAFVYADVCEVANVLDKEKNLEIAKKYMGASYYSGGGRTGMARRLSWDEPSLTLTCSPAQKQTERCHPDETRPFTVREYARIQSFPDDFIFTGGQGAQFRQVGNAVPPLLSCAIAKTLKSYLDNTESTLEKYL